MSNNNLTTVRLKTNTVSLDVSRLKVPGFFQYKIAFSFIEPVKPVPNRKRFEIWNELQIQYPQVFHPRVAFDGVEYAYGAADLGLDTNWDVSFRGNRHPVKVHIVKVLAIDGGQFNPPQTQRPAQTTLNVLNLLVRMGPQSNGVFSGASFFLSSGKTQVRGAPFDLWEGYFQSVRPAFGRFIVNVDVVYAPFYQSGSLLSSMLEYAKTIDAGATYRNLGDVHLQSELKKFARGLRVKIKTPRGERIKEITGLEWNSAQNYTFPYGDREISVEQYYQEVYNIRLDYPRVHCCAKFGKDAVIPLELLWVEEGQIFRHVAPNIVKGEMLTKCSSPGTRFGSIERALKYDQLQHRSSDYLLTSGITVASQLDRVQGHILASPIMKLTKQANINNGTWNVQKDKALKPPDMRVIWAIAYSGALHPRDVEKAHSLQQTLTNRARLFVIDKWPPPMMCRAFNPQNPDEDLTKIAAQSMQEWNRLHPNGQDVRLFLLVIITESIELRRKIKRWGDITYGTRTQIMRADKLGMATGPKSDQYLNNLLLKINTRLGGTNIRIDGSSLQACKIPPRTMLVGLDTSHPPPGASAAIPTFIGVTWSVDQLLSKYEGMIKVQPPRQEIISSVGERLKFALKRWMAYNNQLAPQRVIVYRDGVSEGEFEQVRAEELSSIQAMVHSLEKHINAKIALTYIIVGKRHHIKFVPEEVHNSDKGNAKTGTLVANAITSPDTNIPDFYLLSQPALKGTSKPAHYSILHNDPSDLSSGHPPFTIGDIQRLSYNVCFTQQRATRAISLPTPIYYADLIAGRGDFHLQLSEGDRELQERQKIEFYKARFREVHDNIRASMYWI